MVSQCTIFWTTKAKDRDNATNLDHVDIPVTDPDMTNNNNNNNMSRSRQTSESSDSNSDEFEESKSTLSADSDSDHIILRSDPSQSVQRNNVNANVNAFVLYCLFR